VNSFEIKRNGGALKSGQRSKAHKRPFVRGRTVDAGKVGRGEFESDTFDKSIAYADSSFRVSIPLPTDASLCRRSGTNKDTIERSNSGWIGTICHPSLSVEYMEKALDGGKTPRHTVLLVQF
jgi:hypothetical protein